MSSPRKRPLHTNNHFTLSSESKPKEDKDLDLMNGDDKRPAHQRIHSHVQKSQKNKNDLPDPTPESTPSSVAKHHMRIPTTYPKGDAFFKSTSHYKEHTGTTPRAEKSKKKGCCW